MVAIHHVIHPLMSVSDNHTLARSLPKLFDRQPLNKDNRQAQLESQFSSERE